MYELAYQPHDIIFDYDSISSNASMAEIEGLLDALLEKGYRFFMFSETTTFSYDNPIKNYCINQSFDFHDINEYEGMFLSGDNEQYSSLIVTSDTETVKTATNFGISCVFLVKDYKQVNMPNLRMYPDHVLTLKGLWDLLTTKNGGVKLLLETVWDNPESYCTALYEDELTYYFDERKKIDVVSCGRYFRSNDPRAYSHILTKLILAFKDEKEGAYAALKPALTNFLKDIENEIDYFTVIPCKPGKNNRFEPLFYNGNKLISSKVKLDLINCIRDYPSQKEFGTRQEKAENVRNSFKVMYPDSIKGKTILIIDDILTTGATALECASVLYDSGAEKVILLPLGITQDTFDTMPKLSRVEEEGELYKLRFKKATGQPFWVSGSNNYQKYEVIKKTYLKQNDIENFVYKDMIE